MRCVGCCRQSEPSRQTGPCAGFSVYIDTLLVCTATAMMILACQTYNILDSVQVTSAGEATVSYLQQNPGAPDGEPGVFYTIEAIGTVIGSRAAGSIVSIALFFFAFTTIMAYYYYAETNLVYLFSRFRRNSLRKMRKKNREVEDFEKAKGELERADMAFGDDRNEKVVIWVLRICTVIAVFIGSLTTSGVTWTLGDIGWGLWHGSTWWPSCCFPRKRCRLSATTNGRRRTAKNHASIPRN